MIVFPQYEVFIGDDLGDPEYWNSRFQSLDLRVHGQELIEKDWRSAIQELTDNGIKRIDDAISPILKDLETDAQLGALFVSQSDTVLEARLGLLTVAITALNKRRFAPAATVALVSQIAPYVVMIGTTVGYSRDTGTLTVNVERVYGEGIRQGWTVSATSRVDYLAETIGREAGGGLSSTNVEAALREILTLVPSNTRSLSPGLGLTGGGDFSSDRVLALDLAYTDVRYVKAQTFEAHTHTFNSLTQRPTTVAGYGIADAYTKTEAQALLALKSDVGHGHNISGVAGLQAALDAKMDDVQASDFGLSLLAAAAAPAGRALLGLGALATLSSIGDAQIAAASLSNARLATVASLTLKGRASAGTGSVEDLSPAQVKTILGIGVTDVSGLQGLLDAKQPLLGFTAENLARKGVAGGYAPLGPDSKVPGAYLPQDGSFLGVYDASTNTPALVSGGGTQGDFYIVSKAGTVAADSIGAVNAGDQLRRGPTKWERIPSYNAVTSVAGKTGPVTLVSSDLTDATSLGVSLFTAASATAGRGALGLGTLATLSTVTDAQVAAGSLTNARLANVSSGIFKARSSAGSGSIEDLTPAQAKALLAISHTDITDWDTELAKKAAVDALNASALTTGTVPDARLSGVFTQAGFKRTAAQPMMLAGPAVSGDSLTRTVRDVVTGAVPEGFQGCLVFLAPANANGVMHSFEVSGYRNASGLNAIDFRADGFFSGNAWTKSALQHKGLTRYAVRLGQKASTGQVALIVGDTTTVWSQTYLTLTRMILGGAGLTDAYATGWSVEQTTSLVDYRNIEVPVDYVDTALTARFDAKFNAGLVSDFALSLLDDTSASVMRATLGLGTAATTDAAAYAPIGHVGAGGGAHALATPTTSGFMGSNDKSKLDGVAVNANNYSHPTGDGNLHVPPTGTAANLKVLKAGPSPGQFYWGDVAFGEVTGRPSTLAGYGIADAYTSGAIDTLLSAKQALLNYTAENVAQRGVANGYVPLGSDGKISTNFLPALAITDTFPVSSESAMLAAAAQKGDIAIRLDLNKTFILKAEPATTLANWQEMLTPTDLVTSVAGRTGPITLSSTDLVDSGLVGRQIFQSTTAGQVKGYLNLVTNDIAGLSGALSSKADLTGANFGGIVTAVGTLGIAATTNKGGARLVEGDSVYTGYLAFDTRSGAGGRAGYVGFGSNGVIGLAAEFSGGYFNFTTANGAIGPRVNGSEIYHTGNLNPAAYAPLGGNVTFNRVQITENGSGNSFQLGDDAVMGDVNVANTIGIRGVQNADQGYFAFGNGGRRFGWNGGNWSMESGSLRVGGNIIATGDRVIVGEGQAASYIEMRDTDEGTRYVHNNSGTIGFLGSDGGWKMRVYDSGAIWTSQIGDLNTRIEDRANAYAAGRVAKSGDTMTGNLTIGKNYPGVTLIYGNVRQWTPQVREDANFYIWDDNGGTWSARFDPSGNMIARNRVYAGNGAAWLQENGDVYMPWAGKYLSAALGSKIDKSGGYMTGSLGTNQQLYIDNNNLRIYNSNWGSRQINVGGDGNLFFGDNGNAATHFFMPDGRMWSSNYGWLHDAFVKTAGGQQMSGDLQITKDYPTFRMSYPGKRDYGWQVREDGGAYLWDYTAGTWSFYVGAGGDIACRQLGDINSHIESRANAYASTRNIRLAYAGDLGNDWNMNTDNGEIRMAEPYGGAVMTSRSTTNQNGNGGHVAYLRWRYLQQQSADGNWYTCSYV